jgi:rubrerythrin
MAEEVKNALVILRKAMQIEREGHEFYTRAAETTQDENGREIFRSLSNDEQNHLDLIKRQYQSLAQKNEWANSPGIKLTSVDLDKPIFPRGKQALENAVTIKSSDMDALLIGLDIEIRSYDLYRPAALKTADTLGREMFQFLAGEEMRHFNILMMRYDSLFGPISWSD